MSSSVAAVNAIAAIASARDELTAWRRDLHAHPELAYEEQRTAAFVARELASVGLDVECGLARTGVVATLDRGPGRAVGLRADMDALPMQEENRFAHRSLYDGKMHACGHDGHTVMLLAAARYLAADAALRGKVHFIFQPAEEAAGGARVMVEEGLFDRYPMDAVFGMHNWPGLEAGNFAVRSGAMMASLDCFDIEIVGRGAHGALPHTGADPVLAAAHVIAALQSVVSRNVDPLDPAVVSVTQVRGGHAHNIIPESVQLAGGIRSFEPSVREALKRRVGEIAAGVCAALGVRATVVFAGAYPAVVNTEPHTALAARAAAGIVGVERVATAIKPVLGSEDFSYMLERVPGCYVLIGNGDTAGSCMIHNPGYDFNDDILAVGASYWVRLAESFLAAESA
jgi:amidohydrolase